MCNVTWNFMNQPNYHKWNERDIINEFHMYHDKKKVAKIYRISTKEVNDIIIKGGTE